MNEKVLIKVAATVFMVMLLMLPASSKAADYKLGSGYKVEGDTGAYIKLGAQLQLQYYWMKPDTGSATDKSDDETHFRRLRPYIVISPRKDLLFKAEVDVSEMRWHVAEGEWEMGDSKSANKVTMQNVYVTQLLF